MALKGSGGEERTLEIKIPSYKIPGSWLIGATTYAIDRIIPDVERIWVPEQLHDFEGWVRFRLIPDATAPAIKRTSRKLRLLNYLRPPAPIDLGHRLFFDARRDDYFNWSHQTNFYLSLALAARKWLGDHFRSISPFRVRSDRDRWTGERAPMCVVGVALGSGQLRQEDPGPRRL